MLILLNTFVNYMLSSILGKRLPAINQNKNCCDKIFKYPWKYLFFLAFKLSRWFLCWYNKLKFKQRFLNYFIFNQINFSSWIPIFNNNNKKKSQKIITKTHLTFQYDGITKIVFIRTVLSFVKSVVKNSVLEI